MIRVGGDDGVQGRPDKNKDKKHLLKMRRKASVRGKKKQNRLKLACQHHVAKF